MALELKRGITEITVKDQVLKSIGELIEDLICKITENVDETQESANFTIKCVLDTDKAGNHNFDISGKVSLNTPTITLGAQIIDKHQWTQINFKTLADKINAHFLGETDGKNTWAVK